MSTLTAEQRARIEENRQKALQRLAETRRKQAAAAGAATSPAPQQPTASRAASTTTCRVPFTPAVNKPANSAPGSSSRTVLQAHSAGYAGIPSTSRPPVGATGKPPVAATSAQTPRPPAPGRPSTATMAAVQKNAFYGQPSISGAFRLLSAERFVADVGYNQAVIETFKQMPSRLYDPQEKKWSFALSDHDKLVSLLRQLKPPVAIAPLPAFVLRCLRQVVPPPESMDLSTLDLDLLDTLMPFQREGVRMGIAREGRVLLADDMGLGKTVQAIAIVSFYHDWPLLVVCPSSMRYQWREAFFRFLPSQHPSTIVVMDTSRDVVGDARILIASYDLLTRCADEIRSIGFKSVIMDESHCLKNFKSARTRAAQPLMKAARRCLLLSGTPALSRPIELYTQITAVDPKFGAKFHDFGMRYCAGKRTAWGWDFSGSSNMTELQVLLERRVMIRRLKRDVITQLPAKQRVMVVLDASQVNARSTAMSQLEKRMGLKSLKGMERRGTLLQYFRETASVKLPAVCSYLTDLLENVDKFICFAHHQLVLDGICELLAKLKCEYVRIDGSTPGEQRKQQCDQFQQRQTVRVAVLSITAANTGLTLTAASLVVFAELFWNPGVLTQAEDRAHRIGQQDSVQVRYLVARGTADDYIWPLVQHKLEVLNKAGLSKDNFTDADQETQRQRADSTQASITDFFNQEELEELLRDSAESGSSGEQQETSHGSETHKTKKQKLG